MRTAWLPPANAAAEARPSPRFFLARPSNDLVIQHAISAGKQRASASDLRATQPNARAAHLPAPVRVYLFFISHRPFPSFCSLHFLRYYGSHQSEFESFIHCAQGPSYKRGPPKGYIHAIEQRWHQVESLLGAILQCPDARVQTFVNDLKQDDLAREIIDRVDMGPYVRPTIPT
jgi:hypothetical protein